MSLCGVKCDTACPLLSIADVTVLFSLINGADHILNVSIKIPYVVTLMYSLSIVDLFSCNLLWLLSGNFLL